jgi:diguanylate cyclase (GGDEF)-like protein
VPIIAIIEESSSAARVAYLTSGVDDLLAKPYDGSELVARIRSRLGRTREYLDTSPVTGLPGGTRILNEVRDRIREGKNYAVCHIDIDRFKSVSDRYGFERGAKFIQALGSALVEAAKAVRQPQTFLAHIGGDDFILICSPELVRPIIGMAVASFEVAADQIYDADDAQRGYLILTDRQGKEQRPNLVTVSVGVTLSAARAYSEPRGVIAVASEMTRVAKREPGSFVAYDRPKLVRRVANQDLRRQALTEPS